jgi:hypothetical protein
MSSDDYATSGQGAGRCPRCGEGFLRAWYELSGDEREVVERLPGSADFTLEERMARFYWCTRCWYEEPFAEPFGA